MAQFKHFKKRITLYDRQRGMDIQPKPNKSSNFLASLMIYYFSSQSLHNLDLFRKDFFSRKKCSDFNALAKLHNNNNSEKNNKLLPLEAILSHNQSVKNVKSKMIRFSYVFENLAGFWGRFPAQNSPFFAASFFQSSPSGKIPLLSSLEMPNFC